MELRDPRTSTVLLCLLVLSGACTGALTRATSAPDGGPDASVDGSLDSLPEVNDGLPSDADIATDVDAIDAVVDGDAALGDLDARSDPTDATIDDASMDTAIDAGSDGTVVDSGADTAVIDSDTDASTGTTFEEIALGGHHTCARRSDGTVWCWGKGGAGQLGYGMYVDRSVPTQIDFDGFATQIAMGYEFSCLLDDAETVWCWGANVLGALGVGDTTVRAVPTAVALGNVESLPLLDLSHWHAAVVTSSGNASAWGANHRGQLGDGTYDPDPGPYPSHPNPATIPGLSNVRQLGLGEFHDCALHDNGTVSCWGYNGWGELGDGTFSATPDATPGLVPGLSNVEQIALGQQNTCALLTDQTVKCWGVNTSGKLGDGTTFARFSPTAIPSFTGVAQIALGFRHTCAVKTNGTLWCWGANDAGQLGNGEMDVDPPDAPPPAHPTPTQVSGLSGVAQVALGDSHTCVLKANDTIWCWGSNTNGRLGDSTTTAHLTPHQVPWP